ncbi:MAG: hypothetical protein AMXMBFR64_39190 [Myxococcales bacterium]
MTATTSSGPVSAALEADLRTWVRRHGVVVWLDLDGHYTGFVDRLRERRAAGELPYEVAAFRGSHLALMLALEGAAAGVERAPLVVHLPGFNEEAVRATPVLALYAAGVRYRKALDTLVTEAAAGRVRPERIAERLAGPGLTLEVADAWLAGLLAEDAGGLGAQLRAMAPAAVLDDLLGGGFVAGRIAGGGADAAALWERLAAWTGLPGAWRDATLPPGGVRAEDVAFVAASWALCVEYVDDLARPPVSGHLGPARALPRPVIDACRALAAHLRERHPGFYGRTADETEALLGDEVEAARAEDLGKVDTFRFEEDKVLAAALDALGRGDWALCAGWADARLDGPGAGSFWLRQDPARRSAWELVRAGARLGQALARAGERLVGGPSAGRSEGLAGAVARYVERGAAVDQAHRHLEQRRVALLLPQLPEADALRARLDGLRRAWRAWADAWARDFSALCRADGFLPPAELQQRTLFDDVVRPLTREPGVTALFVVDALRYEMGEELARQLDGTAATTVRLDARLCELPSVTAVGMNVLAPVCQGRLVPVIGPGGITGFQAGEFRVSDPESRRRAMHDRVGGGTCPWLSLDEVTGRDVPSLRKAVAQARLVVVHSLEIDAAGESGAGPGAFDLVMQKLRAAWRLLRDAGVRRFVFTADHGFLLLDDTAGGTQAHGRRVDPKRRHVLSPVGADHPGEVRVALADLGYEGATGHLMFPETTAVFDTGHRPATFVHGGSSLQERVIPVLTVVHRAAAGGSAQEYALRAAAREGVAGMHCIEARVDVAAQASLDFGGAREVELALRVPDAPDVQVELCQTRGRARLARGLVVATVGEPFELFFRLEGGSDRRVRVELHHPSAAVQVAPCAPEGRFAVEATRAGAGGREPEGDRWLSALDDPAARAIFGHLAAHGAVTEDEAAALAGGPRALRRFAVRLEEHGRRAPFGVRIDVVAGVKRYVREGGTWAP